MKFNGFKLNLILLNLYRKVTDALVPLFLL
jgi:hypothetical protein